MGDMLTVRNVDEEIYRKFRERALAEKMKIGRALAEAMNLWVEFGRKEVEKDQNHQQAVKIRDDIIRGKFGKLFISDYIFDETVTVTLGRTKDIKKVIFIGEHLKASSKIFKVDEKIFRKAWTIFKEQKETYFSFTDCTTIGIMDENDITNIATFDKEFRNVPWIKVIG